MEHLESVQSSLGVTLNREQLRSVEEVFNNGPTAGRRARSVLITGQAGTGKSVVLRVIRSIFERLEIPAAVASSTGISALHVEGVTFHSFLGCGLANDSVPSMVEFLEKKNKKALARLRRTKVLILDEVSMIHPTLFQTADGILRGVRTYTSDSPFGGMRFIMFGDFFQLPPVHRTHPSDGAFFCHQTESWKLLNPIQVELREQMRQSEDRSYADMLGRMRVGRMEPKDHEMIRRRVGIPLNLPGGIIPTRLYSKNVDVDDMNLRELRKLTGHKARYAMKTWFVEESQVAESKKRKAEEDMTKFSTIPKDLVLVEGAQVMLCFNMDVANGLANGSRGVVIGFSKPDMDQVPAEFFEFARPAPDADRDINGGKDDDEEDGGGNPSPKKRQRRERPPLTKIKTNINVRTLLGSENGLNHVFLPNVPHPLVRFQMKDGSPKDVLIPFFAWRKPVALEAYGLKGVRNWVWACQVPLRLAWAMTIHKSQGATLDAIEISTADAFEAGQVYVAFSRARSLQSITVNTYDEQAVWTHPALNG